MSLNSIRRVVVPTLALLFAPAAAFAQQQRTLTTADYARAERQLAPTTTPLVYGSGVRPTFLPDERFWYRVATPTGTEFIIVDPAKGTRARAFDQEKVAAGLSAATGTTYTAMQLPFQTYDYTSDGSIRVRVGQRRYDCNAATGPLRRVGRRSRSQRHARGAGPGGRGGARPQVPSPDGKRAAFIRDYNLWVRDVATGKETQLTTDGVKDFGYATDNAGWTHSDRADSRLVARLEEDRDVPAGRAQRRRHVSRRHAASVIPKLQRVEVSASGRQHHPDDPARHHRRRPKRRE